MSTVQPNPSQVCLAPGGDKASGLRGTMVARVLHVHVAGTLTNLAMAGPSGACWRLLDGKQIGVFGVGGEIDTQVATNQLSTAHIHEITVLQDRSTFPVPLGVRINCIPGSEVTDLGDRFAYTVLPLTQNSVGQTVYQCEIGSEEGLQWRKDFPKWTHSNLETEGVLNVENNPWVFVHQDHPVIAILRHNEGLVGCKIDDQPKIDQEWFKVTRQVLQACCDTLRTKVLQKVQSHDLNTLQLQLVRLNAENWDDVNELGAVLSSASLTSEDATVFLTTPYSYTARVLIKYEIQPV